MKRLKMALEEAHTFIEGKKIICFGAGLQGLRFINILENWKMQTNILAFIDNDCNKWGKKISYGGYQFPIVSLRKAFPLFNQNIVLIITCVDFINIEKQLQIYKELENTLCFTLTELAQEQLIVSDYEKVVCESQEPIIPKIIHYCWFGDKMPDMLSNNVNRWRELCPDYEIIEWNETNYDISKNLYTKQAYDMKKWGYVPDYIRLDLIYKYGGIYLDTDVEMLKRPDELLYQSGFASCDGSLLMNLGNGFGAGVGGKVIKELRDYYDNIKFVTNDKQYNKAPCTLHSYNVLKKYSFFINDTLQKVGDINIYPMVFQGACSLTKQMRITDKTFFLHYGTQTWIDKKNSQIINEISKLFEENNYLKSYNNELR